MRLLGALLATCVLARAAFAGEVHTGTTPGSWSSDPARGTMRGTIGDDAGWSFWLLGDPISLATPVTVIAQVRFVRRVDYGGAGIAIIDARATNTEQKHLRVELSERDDTVGVGGWFVTGKHFASGTSIRAGKDIRPGQWYEVALKVDGTRAVGYLDGVEVFYGEIPELGQMPAQLTIAPYVIEADVEMKVTLRASPPAAMPEARVVKVESFGRGPHAEWVESHELKGDRLCVRVASLRAPSPPATKLAIGYAVTLEGAVFDTGSRTKRIVVYEFAGTPTQATHGRCETIAIGGAETAPPPPPVEDRLVEPDPPVQVRSRTQAEIEKELAKNKAFERREDGLLVLGEHRLLLDALTKKWLLFDPLHRTWEPTGFSIHEVTFSLVKGRIAVKTKRRGAKPR